MNAPYKVVPPSRSTTITDPDGRTVAVVPDGAKAAAIAAILNGNEPREDFDSTPWECAENASKRGVVDIIDRGGFPVAEIHGEHRDEIARRIVDQSRFVAIDDSESEELNAGIDGPFAARRLLSNEFVVINIEGRRLFDVYAEGQPEEWFVARLVTALLNGHEPPDGVVEQLAAAYDMPWELRDRSLHTADGLLVGTFGPDTDQNGTPRVQDGFVDVGPARRYAAKVAAKLAEIAPAASRAP